MRDLNECSLGVCDVFAHCTNTIGSFKCTCNEGYQGNGLQCTGEHHYIQTTFLEIRQVRSRTGYESELKCVIAMMMILDSSGMYLISGNGHWKVVAAPAHIHRYISQEDNFSFPYKSRHSCVRNP